MSSYGIWTKLPVETIRLHFLYTRRWNGEIKSLADCF
jgi:hypothetical protein